MPSLRGGDLTREGLLTPPMPSTRADSNPVSGLPTPADPESGDGTGPSGAAVEMLLACQKSAKSPQRSTGYNDAPWEVFWVFTVLVWQTTNLPGLVVSEGIGGTSGTNLGSRNYPVVKRREYTQNHEVVQAVLGVLDGDVPQQTAVYSHTVFCQGPHLPT